jgi:uroporphyrinogen decarboxylase
VDGRERLQTIIAGEAADRCGFWLGNPHGDTVPLYKAHFGVDSIETLRRQLGDDFRWLPAAGFDYRRPDGRGLFDFGVQKCSHGQAGYFAECHDPQEVYDADWPKADHLDFSADLEKLRNAGPYYRASGLWTCFYHNVMDLFGMENYLVKMCIEPEVVHAVTDKVCEFYYEANERFFVEAGAEVDGFFFGNDFGTQVNLICTLEQFDAFIMPWFKKFTDQGHRHGHQVLLHSCGAIHKVIDRLIDAGVDCLHPLQAKAADMDAETLARDFKGRIAFLGGVDTQDLLVNAGPDDIRAEVYRLKALLGPNFIVSPSHEALLPNVPPENVAAMAEAATE